MRVYKRVNHVFDESSDDFQRQVNMVIENNQRHGFQSEIQYSSCAGSEYVFRYSALILAYTEE